MEELKPSTWSVFHKTVKEKEKEIKIIKEIEPDTSVNAPLEREADLIELHTEICTSENSDTKPTENNIDSLWRELQELGSLPVNHKDEDTKEDTTHPAETDCFKIMEKKKEEELTSGAINIPVIIEERANDANKSDSSKQTLTEIHTVDRIEDEEMRISSHLAPGMNLKLKETQIGSETCRNIKTLQSSLKRKNKATVLISTKIPIRQEKSPISSQNAVQKSINADCHHHNQTG